MSASVDSDATHSPATESSIVALNDSSVFSPSPDQIGDFINTIRANAMMWSIGDKLGVAYHFLGDRLLKQNNVVNRSGVRTRLEIRNLDVFFAKLRASMMEFPFVKIQLCGNAEAHLMYCHSKLVRLEPKRNVLLLGDVCFVQGHFNNYFAEPIPIKAGTLVKLYARTFDIRVSSNRHCIFVRTEDIIKNRVRMEPLDLTGQQQTSPEDVEANSDESGDELDEDYEPDSAIEDEEHSSDGSRGRHRPATFPRRDGRASDRTGGTPQQHFERRGRLVFKARPNRIKERVQGQENNEAHRDDQQQRGPHSL